MFVLFIMDLIVILPYFIMNLSNSDHLAAVRLAWH